MLASQTAISRAKSPEAFRTISEVSAELDVPQHVLRFWESRFAQVRPTKRAGGRRYYRPEDVDLLRGIRALLYSEGFTIRGVQKILRDRGLKHVMQLGRASVGAPDDSSHEEDINRRFGRPGSSRGEPRYARAVLAVVEREHSTPHLAKAERGRLEALLTEMLQLKSRLRTARARA